MAHQRYFLVLVLLFLIEFVFLAFSPHDRKDWLLENALVLVLAVGMAISYRKFPLSRVSYTLLFIFVCLHEIGAHYTYAEVPYDDFLMSRFHFSLNALMGWERNNFKIASDSSQRKNHCNERLFK